jgi:hypothetical protein
MPEHISDANFIHMEVIPGDGGVRAGESVKSRVGESDIECRKFRKGEAASSGSRG